MSIWAAPFRGGPKLPLEAPQVLYTLQEGVVPLPEVAPSAAALRLTQFSPPYPPSQTVRFKNELERNITIKLGYANAKIYKCDNEACPRPDCFKACGSSTADTRPCDRTSCGGTLRLLRHVSFVDWYVSLPLSALNALTTPL